MSDTIAILLGGDFSVPGCQVPGKPLWSDALEKVMASADYRVLNLEGALTINDTRRPKIGVALRGLPKFAAFLKQNHVDMVSLANNHIFDFEDDGVMETIELCDEQSIAHAGIIDRSNDKSLPVRFVDIKGKRIGFYCLAEHEFNYKDDFSLSTVLLEPARNVLEIQQARRECDGVVVFSHIGPEGTAYPSPRMVSLFHCFVEAGATAVINTHAHHVMGMEHYKNAPIFYGLGNLLFCMNSKMPGWYEGMMAKLELHNGGTCIGTPFFTAFDTKGMVVRLDDSPGRQAEFQQISNILSNSRELDERWHDFCDSQRKHILKECVKGGLAMMPYYLKSRIFGASARESSSSYFAKGTRMLRGMFQCENHADVLARIFRDLGDGK